MKRNSNPFAHTLAKPLRTPRGLIIRRIEQRDSEPLRSFYRAASLQITFYARRYHKRYFEIRRHSKPPVQKQRAFWNEQIRGWRSKPVTPSRTEYYFIFNPKKEIVGVIQLYWKSGKPTLGYFASPQHRGKGYMKEAVKHFANAASAAHHRTSLAATANTTNHASHAILKNAGFGLWGSTRRGHLVENDKGMLDRRNNRPYFRKRPKRTKKASL